MNIKIRHERKNDYDEIKRINDLAFGQENEGKMIEALRKTSNYDTRLSLVAILDNNIIGHILFYQVKIKTNQGKLTVLSLAPIAVHPHYQNKGIGSQLVRKGIEVAKDCGFDAIIVVGHPTYYPRFGFKKASIYEIKCPFEVPDEAFLALEIKENILKNCKGTIEFPKEYFEAI